VMTSPSCSNWSAVMRVLEGCKDSNRKGNQKIGEIYRFDDVGSFEESVFASIPEGQVSFSVRYHEIVVQRVEDGAG
jgi:hypothetical protein